MIEDEGILLLTSGDPEKVLSIIRSMLFKINTDVMGGRLIWRVLVDGAESKLRIDDVVEASSLNLDLFLETL